MLPCEDCIDYCGGGRSEQLGCGLKFTADVLDSPTCMSGVLVGGKKAFSLQH